MDWKARNTEYQFRTFTRKLKVELSLFSHCSTITGVKNDGESPNLVYTSVIIKSRSISKIDLISKVESSEIELLLFFLMTLFSDDN